MSDKDEFLKFLQYESASINDLALFTLPSRMLAKIMVRKVERKMKRLRKFNELSTRLNWHKHMKQ